MNYHETKNYTDLEQDLCEIYHCETIDESYEEIKELFIQEFKEFENEKDYELTEWHYNIKMLWVYLYNDEFYNSNFPERIKSILSKMNSEWFAQFEGHTTKLNLLGWFLIYKDSIVFDQSKEWKKFIEEIKKKGITKSRKEDFR